jgi:hypothetical protein
MATLSLLHVRPKNGPTCAPLRAKFVNRLEYCLIDTDYDAANHASVTAWLATIEPELEPQSLTTLKQPLQPVSENIQRNSISQRPSFITQRKPYVIRSSSIHIPRYTTAASSRPSDVIFSLTINHATWHDLTEADKKHPYEVGIRIRRSIERIAFERGSSGILQTIILANLHKQKEVQAGFWETVEAEALKKLPSDTDYFVRVFGELSAFRAQLTQTYFEGEEFYVGIFGGHFVWMSYEEARDRKTRLLGYFT